jgi:acyl-CoA dehydrogenase
MDDGLSDTQRMIAQTVRRFVRRELWLWEKRIDANASVLAPEVVADLQPMVTTMELDHLEAPERLGGPRLDLVTRLVVAEEMSQHRAGVLAPGYGLFGVDAPPQLYAGTAAQEARFLVPLLRGESRCFVELSAPLGPGAPTDGVRTRARWMGSEWMLDGTKIFVAGAEGADFGVVLANTEAQSGERDGVSWFVVESDRVGFQRWRSYPTLGVGRETMELNFSNLRLPADHLLGVAGEGLALGGEWVARRAVLQAAQAVGVASAAQDMAVQQAAGRREFGVAIGRQPGVKQALADNEEDVRGSRMAAWAAAARLEEPDHSDDALRGAAEVRMAALEEASRVVDRTIQLYGGAGVSADLPLERWFRELRVRRAERMGNEALGLGPG